MQLTKHFNISEFDCHDGSKMPPKVLANIIKLIGNLETIREKLNSPMLITSAYRSVKYNKSIGGVKSSQHLLGTASDFQTKGYETEMVYDVIESLISEGLISEGGLGLYKTFIHYDIRGNKARWDYRNR
jgi:uncharacterized protein YcbK (DUF882 family)